jgi:hypothetical protein
VDQRELLDENLYKIIDRCYINNRRSDVSEIHVIYTDGARENIWTFNPERYDFDRQDLIGLTKIAAVFYCDRKEPKSIQLY